MAPRISTYWYTCLRVSPRLPCRWAALIDSLLMNRILQKWDITLTLGLWIPFLSHAIPCLPWGKPAAVLGAALQRGLCGKKMREALATSHQGTEALSLTTHQKHNPTTNHVSESGSTRPSVDPSDETTADTLLQTLRQGHQAKPSLDSWPT